MREGKEARRMEEVINEGERKGVKGEMKGVKDERRRC